MIDPARIYDALIAAGLPVQSVRTTAGVPAAVWNAGVTPTTAQTNAANAILADPNVRNVMRPRLLVDIYADLQALSAANKTAVWNDLNSGTPKKYLAGRGGNAAAIAGLDWAVTNSGATGAALTAAQLRVAAMYCQDFPKYLVNPSFAASILIRGDEAAP